MSCGSRSPIFAGHSIPHSREGATRRRSRALSTRLHFEPIPPPAQSFRDSARHGRRLATSGAGSSPATTRRRRLPRPFAAWRGCVTHRRTGSSRRPTRSRRDASTLTIRLRSSWRRFPYALTVVGASPRFIAGPFKLVSGTKRLVVARREGLTLQFRRLGALAARREFRAGEARRGTGAAWRRSCDQGRRADRERGKSTHPAWPRSRRVRSDRLPASARIPRHCGPRRLRAADLRAQRFERLRLPRRRGRRTRRGFAVRSTPSRRCRGVR